VARQALHLLLTVNRPMTGGAGMVLQFSDHSKKLIAESWARRGMAFVVAASLLSEHAPKSEDAQFAALHMLAQGTEILLKGLLLLKDFDGYKPKMKSLGHNLNRIADEVVKAYAVPVLREPLNDELVTLSDWYSKHLLRYESGRILFIPSSVIQNKRIVARLSVIYRLVQRNALT
jgi:hypothetical protein